MEQMAGDEPQEPPVDTALSVRKLGYSFQQKKALDGVTFDVHPGTIHGFVGPNGAGKTTTLKIVATLLEPQRGSVRVFGDDVKHKTFKVRRAIGYMPDHFGMYRQMTVFEYLDFFAAAYGQPADKRDQTIHDVLELTDMGGRRDDLIGSLSRGMEQRVSLARVLVHDPKLLLLDEPASGLDPRARIELMEILRELARMGKTVLISSHILSELSNLCGDVTIIDRGAVKYTGSMKALLEHGSMAYLLRLGRPSPATEQALAALPGVTEVAAEIAASDGFSRLRVTVEPDAVDTGRILRAALDAGADIVGFERKSRQLDEVFMDLTEPGVPQ